MMLDGSVRFVKNSVSPADLAGDRHLRRGRGRAGAVL